MSEPQPQDTVPEPQNTVPEPQASLPTKSDTVADVPLPLPFTNVLALQSPTSQPFFSRAKLWPIIAAISTVFLIYSIINSDKRQVHRPAAKFSSGSNLEIWSCHPHKPSNFGAEKDLAARVGLKLVEDVPAEKVPGGGRKFKNGEDHGRVIVVGDVHGMFHELVSLLTKVKFNVESDYLILAGDMISKGPDSLKVLDLLRSHGAGCVRGNHEDRILLHYHQLQKKQDKKKKKKQDKKKQDKKHKQAKHPGHKKAEILRRGYNADLEDDMEMDDMEMDDMEMDDMEQEDDTPQQLIGEGQNPDLSPFENSQLRTDQKLARKLTRKQVAWLEACPLVLRMKKVANLGQVEVVHAGLVHGVQLEDQDPNAIMNMRTLDRRCHLPSSETRGQHWANLWNREEKKIEKGGEHTTVIYGHYAAAGLDIRGYTKGLDSNCVRGGSLTAYVISSKHQEIVSVKCRNYLKD